MRFMMHGLICEITSQMNMDRKFIRTCEYFINSLILIPDRLPWVENITIGEGDRWFDYRFGQIGHEFADGSSRL